MHLAKNIYFISANTYYFRCLATLDLTRTSRPDQTVRMTAMNAQDDMQNHIWRATAAWAESVSK